MDQLLTAEALLALVTLTALEIVLGVDNIIFISVLVGRLPPAQRPRGRRLGLMLAMGTRILLLLLLTWIMRLQGRCSPCLRQDIPGRDLIDRNRRTVPYREERPRDSRKLGRLGQARTGRPRDANVRRRADSDRALDIVFSLDSVITAVGMANDSAVMIAAVVIAVVVMMFAAGAIGRFVDAHPTVKMLALSFLLMIGVTLIAESLDQHIPKGYIYFAMAFSVMVEMLNLRMKKVTEEPVHLRRAQVPGTE